MKQTISERMRQLEARGFDECHAIKGSGGSISVHCSQCSALVINGVPCHETHCPNTPRECGECGNVVPSGETCCEVNS